MATQLLQRPSSKELLRERVRNAGLSGDREPGLEMIEDASDFQSPLLVDVSPQLGRRLVRSREKIFGEGNDWLVELGGDFAMLVERHRISPERGMPVEGSLGFNQKEAIGAVEEAWKIVTTRTEVPKVSEDTFDKGTIKEEILDQVSVSLQEKPRPLIDFKFLGEKTVGFLGAGIGKTAGFIESSLKGLFNRKETPKLKSEEEQKEEAAKKKKKGIIQASYSAAQNALSIARAVIQESLMKLQNSLGLGGLSRDQLQSYRGENTNKSSEELTVASLHEAARGISEAAKIQKAKESAAKAQSAAPKDGFSAQMQDAAEKTGGGHFMTNAG